MTVLLVGEQPPLSWEKWPRDEFLRKHSPMFPFPVKSSGHRLYQISGLALGEYVHGLTRLNLVPDFRKWKRDDAEELARNVYLRFAPVTHVFLCGKRVVSAFRPFFLEQYMPALVERIDRNGLLFKTIFYCIPHPSGRSTAYNDPATRDRVNSFFQEVRPLLRDWSERRGHNEKRLVCDGH